MCTMYSVQSIVYQIDVQFIYILQPLIKTCICHIEPCLDRRERV